MLGLLPLVRRPRCAELSCKAAPPSPLGKAMLCPCLLDKGQATIIIPCLLSPGTFITTAYVPWACRASLYLVSLHHKSPLNKTRPQNTQSSKPKSFTLIRTSHSKILHFYAGQLQPRTRPHLSPTSLGAQGDFHGMGRGLGSWGQKAGGQKMGSVLPGPFKPAKQTLCVYALNHYICYEFS